MELQDLGRYGFMLPANYVEPVGRELWEGVKVIAHHVIKQVVLNFTENISVMGKDYIYGQNITKDKTDTITHYCPTIFSNASYCFSSSLLHIIVCFYLCKLCERVILNRYQPVQL